MWADANHSIFAYGFPITGPITLEIYKTITCSKIILYMIFKINEQEVTSKKKNVEPNADLKGLTVAASAVPNYLLSKICN